MTECLECRENEKMFSVSMLYKCSNDFCVNFIKPVSVEPITPLKVLITPSYNRRAIDKYTASHKEQIKAKRKEYCYNNREQIHEQRAQYYEINKEKIKEQ